MTGPLSTELASDVDGAAVEVDQPVADEPSAVPLTEPRDGVPAPLIDAGDLAAAVEVLRAGSGPVAVDAERASGYRYGQRAYLVQLRRQDVGTLLIDPTALPDLSDLGAAIGEDEWVLHAASQDLPCLRELGMTPTRIFDTELAGRLLGHPRVGLGPIVEEVLGLSLEKGHSAADWSTRPLPEPWLRYAALDVEVLVELRDALAAELDEQGKRKWAEEEFAAIVAAPPPPPRVEPWRRTSGLHRVRKRRQLAVVRSLWERRDEVAQRRDIAPGRVLPDAALVGAALSGPRTEAELVALPVWGGRSMRRQTATWLPAIERALAAPEVDLPELKTPHEGPPPARSWPERDPTAAGRLSVARTAVAAIADEHRLPVENLLTPDTVRRLSWEPPGSTTPTADLVADFLTAHGARPWQVALTAAALAGALDRAARHLEVDDSPPPAPSMP
ncbi:MAG: ribonuclease D [Spirochaetaceae bacterium]|nr:ribonuclease D [Spirochaetaceae bacterium]